ncbi:hypothetical protein NC651_007735 [Populus alba x Populus x berolinensis]|nr:hypothetical protein NC651_007735 [Populus alba x Populus x berolinensis]
MCYLWLMTSQSLFPVALITNSLVHVVMYYYYLWSAMGVRPKWKRLDQVALESGVGASMLFSMLHSWLFFLIFMVRAMPTKRQLLVKIKGYDLLINHT